MADATALIGNRLRIILKYIDIFWTQMEPNYMFLEGSIRLQSYMGLCTGGWGELRSSPGLVKDQSFFIFLFEAFPQLYLLYLLTKHDLL